MRFPWRLSGAELGLGCDCHYSSVDALVRIRLTIDDGGQTSLMSRRMQQRRDTVDLKVPWTCVERLERVAGRVWRLWSLDDFERHAVVVEASARSLPLRQRQDLSPMFGVPWGSTRVLAERVYALADLTHARVLEIGCGLALPSLVAAAAGAQVLATDHHPAAPAFLAENCRRNDVHTITFAELDWREPKGILASSFDVVLAADVLFAIEAPPLVARLFAHALAPGALGILVDPGRAWLQEFSDAAEAEGLDVEMAVDSFEHDGQVDEVFVLTLRARAKGL